MANDTKLLNQDPKFQNAVKRLANIAVGLPHIVVRADGDFQAKQVNDIVDELVELGATTEISGGGTGKDDD